MLQILHEDPKESLQLVENVHPMTRLKISYFVFNRRKKLIRVWNNLSVSK